MSVSYRNQVKEGAQPLSALEAIFGESDGALAGVQPFGLLDGRFRGIGMRNLLNGGEWVVTDVGTTSAKAIQSGTASLPPHLKITTGTSQHNNCQLQHGIASTMGSDTVGAFGEHICKTGYSQHFYTRFRLTTTVANAVLLLGLSVVDTTQISSSALDMTDFVGLYKAASSAKATGLLRASSTNTSIDIEDLVVNNWYEFGMHIKDRTNVTFWLKDISTGTTTRVGQSTVTNLPANTVSLTPTIVIGASTAAAATLEVAGFFAGQEGF